MVTVSRIDPRKGLRVLPETVAMLRQRGIEATLDIIGPTVGRPGEDERTAIATEAERHGVGDRVMLRGPVALDTLLPMYRQYDVFVLPTLPGEGIPRVLLEAMSGGVPIVTTAVAGIPGLILHEINGLLVEHPTPTDLANAIARVVGDDTVRRQLIANGYDTARRFTLDVQAARMMDVVSRELNVALARPVALPAA
jgi:glycosyltransferase involved in cell wall biosynthesis